MHWHTSHIAAFVASHRCQRYLRLITAPTQAQDLLPPGDLPLPDHSIDHTTPAPTQIYTWLAKAYQEHPTQWASAPPGSDNPTRNTEHLSCATIETSQQTGLTAHSHNDLLDWLEQAPDTPSYLAYGTWQGELFGRTLHSSAWLLRHEYRNQQRQLLLAAVATPGERHQTRLHLGLQAALLQATLKDIPDTEQKGPKSRACQIEATLFEETDPLAIKSTFARRHLPNPQAQVRSFLQGQRGFDLRPYKHAMANEWQQLGDADVSQASKSLQELPMAWDVSCERCPFHRHCQLDLSHRQDIALVPGISPSARQHLQQQGIRQIQQLAGLKRLPDAPDAPMETAQGLHAITSSLEDSDEPGIHLDTMIQRARRMARRYALRHKLKAPSSRHFLAQAPAPRSPDTSRYYGLKQAWIDIQCDPHQGYAYLCSALLVSPKGTLAAIELTPATPTLPTEYAMLSRWCRSISQWLADDLSAPGFLHIYATTQAQVDRWQALYQRHRGPLHRDFPTTMTWLKQPALFQQDLVTYVCDEALAHINLPSSSTSLYCIAEALGFVWPQALHKAFREGLFDTSTPADAPSWLFATNQRSQHEIPIQYAQRLWQQMPSDTRYRQGTPPITPLLFRELAAARLAALQAITKHLPLAQTNAPTIHAKQTLLAYPGHDRQEIAAQTPTEWDILSTGWLLWRAAQLACAHQGYARPVAQRLREGLAFPLRHDQQLTPGWQGQHRFALPTSGGLTWTREAHARYTRLQPGDAMVLHPIGTRDPWQIRTGWLCRLLHIEDLEGESTFVFEGLIWLGKGQDETLCAWRHQRPDFAPDAIYLATYAADAPAQLRESKVSQELATHPLRQSVSTTLTQRALSDSFDGESQHQPSKALAGGLAQKRHNADVGHSRSRPSRDLAGEIAGLWHEKATPQQVRCIVEHHTTRWLSLQGAPGTGKTQTLHWSLLYRIATAASEDRDFRVFFCMPTHQTCQRALLALQREWDALLCQSPKTQWPSLRFAQAVTNPINKVEGLDSFHPDRVNRKLYAEGHLILGGTPSTAYKIQRKATCPNGLFDLVVIDEAQSMRPLEGLMATSCLKPTGQLLVAGDPELGLPLPAQPWVPAAPASAGRPDIPETFHQWIRNQPDCSKEQLHSSFRLPAAMTQLLDQSLYWEHFPRPTPETPGLVNATPKKHPTTWFDQDLSDPMAKALYHAPYAIILLVHEEANSHQSNPFEAAVIQHLLSPLCGPEQGTKPEVRVIVGSRRQSEYIRALCGLEQGAVHTSTTKETDETPPSEVRLTRPKIGLADDFLGEECDLIIASATMSSPKALQRELRYQLHPRRQWLAWSRHKEQLIILVSRSIFALPIDNDAALRETSPWHTIKGMATNPLGRWEIEGYPIEGWGFGRKRGFGSKKSREESGGGY